MNKKFWVTSSAIVGFFAVMVLGYYVVSTNLWQTKQPSVAEDKSAFADEATHNERQSSAADQNEETEQQPVKVLLRIGDSGEAVSDLQQQLNTLGYELTVDGKYGPKTQWYVKDIQLQAGLSGDGSFDTATETYIQRAHSGEVTVIPGKAIHLDLSDNTITNPADLLALVNKTRSLPADYVPEELIEPDVPRVFQGDDLPYNKMRREAAEALEELFEQGEQAGLQLVARSGYRSYDTQVAVFNRNVEQNGEEAANKYSARPGESEHQTGLVMDVTCPTVNNELVVAFEDTDEGKWLQQYAADFGFIIRYPEGKEDITGYQYEPWHLRYVGTDAAQVIMSQNLTLEEYILKHT